MFLLLQTGFRFMGMLCSHKRERERRGAVIERERERGEGRGAAQSDTCTSIQDSSV